jgi:adenylate cyclase
VKFTFKAAPALHTLGRAAGSGRAIAALILLALLACRLFDPTPVEILRLRVFDFFQRLAPRVEATWPVVIVDIDEASLKALGQWPWPRTVIARLVDRLAASGAAAVGFDMVFSESDRTSGAALPAFLPDLPLDIAARLESLPSNDDVLAESLKRYGRAVLGQASYAFGESAPSAAPGAPFTIGEIGGDPRPYLFSFATVLENLDELSAAAAGRGSVSLAPEVDEVVRRVPAVVRVGERVIPAQTLELLRVATGQKSYAVRTDAHGISAVVINGVGAIPTDRSGRIYVRFGPHEAQRFVSAADVLSGKIGAERLAGRLVLVGASVPLLRDLRATPVTAAMPGVEVHAQLLENILSQTFLTRPNYAQALELGLVLGAGLLLLVLVPLVGARWTLALLLVLVGALAAGSWLAFSRIGLLVDATYPIVSATLLYLFLAYTGYAVAERQRKQVSNAFEHYLSPVMVRRLMRDPAGLRLGGESREMTVMFSDIRDFTTISERYRADPQGLTRLINRFLTHLGDAVLEQDGTIDKYIGDSLMAFWNAPLDIENHAAQACAAALAMVAALDRLNEELRTEHGGTAIRLRVGIGLNTGECVVGNLGSMRRLNYSVLGDPVNLASRVEGLCKLYGVGIVVTEDTRRQAPDFAVVELDVVAVKGRAQAVRIYAVLGGPEMAATEQHQRLRGLQARMLEAYRGQRWDDAESVLESCEALAPNLQVLHRLYRQRVSLFRDDPPAPDWDGVFIATDK